MGWWTNSDAAAEAFRAKERGATDADAERLLSMLVRHGADRLPHTHARSLTAHCGGVGALLAAWGQPKHIVRAGLYHSVYATEMYPWPVFHFTQRRFTQARRPPSRRLRRRGGLWCATGSGRVSRGV
jgi:hypothetical protein